MITPIDTRHLFKAIALDIIGLLKSVPPAKWNGKTCYPNWRVKDIIAHMLQTAMYRLSKQRDSYKLDSKGGTPEYTQLSGWIEDANERWVSCYTEVSPEVLLPMFEETELQLAELMEAQDLETPPFYKVAWADESIQFNWMDVAREYTERWHHQMQVREALGLPLLYDKKYFVPLLDILALSLPKWLSAYKPAVPADIVFTLSGELHYTIVLQRQAEGWTLTARGANRIAGHLQLSAEVFWKLLMRSISPEQAKADIQLEGDSKILDYFLNARAVMSTK